MFDELPVNYPPKIREAVGRRTKEKFAGGKVVSPGLVDHLILKTDAEYIKARGVVKTFKESRVLEDKGVTVCGEYTKVREYRRAGTGLVVSEDGLAPGAVVITRRFVDNQTEPHSVNVYWISDSGKDENGKPLVFVATSKSGVEVPDIYSVARVNPAGIDKVFMCDQPAPEGKSERKEIDLWVKNAGEKKGNFPEKINLIVNQKDGMIPIPVED